MASLHEGFPVEPCRLGDDLAILRWKEAGGQLDRAFPFEDWNPLQLMSAEGNLRGVRVLLNNGADANARIQTAIPGLPWHASLHIAARYGHVEVVRTCGPGCHIFSSKRLSVSQVSLLIERGADVNLPDSHGFTALHYAALNGHSRTVSS